MTRQMLDGIASDAATMAQHMDGVALVAGYDDGLYAWSAADWDRFPDAVHVHIVVKPTTNSGHVLDVETGNDMTPAHWISWVQMRRKAGADPTIYTGQNTFWSAVRSAFQDAGVAEPHYWIANYPAPGSPVPPIPDGAVALQYADKGAYDLSVVADYWPGVDPLLEADMTDEERNWLLNLYNAMFFGGTSMGVTPAGASSNSLVAKLDALLAAPAVDVKALAAALAALVQPAITQAIQTGIAPEADQLALAFEAHLAATLAAGK